MAQSSKSDIDDELDTIEAIFGDDYHKSNDNTLSIKLKYSDFDVIIYFEINKYPKDKPSVCLKYDDKYHCIKSIQKQSLKQCIDKRIKQSIFESDKYLFDFVETMIECINEFFENEQNDESKSNMNEHEDNDMISTYIFQYDHMRNEIKYISTIKKWCNELQLYGRLLFYKNIICHIIQGSSKSCQIFINLSKTQKVDINSKGQKCKEKMLKTLYQTNDDEIQKLYSDWKVIKVTNSNDFLAHACDDKIVLSILKSACQIH